jgi:hypothetical protein
VQAAPDDAAGSPHQLDRTATPTSPSEISGLVVLIVTAGYVDVVPCRWSSCYSRIAGVHSAATAAQDPGSGPCGPPSRRSCAPCPAGTSLGPSSAGRHPGLQVSVSGARPFRARIERSGDVALTVRMLWTGGASSRGRFCRMSDVLGDKAEGVSIRFARSGIQSPRQHHPRRPGERRGPKRSGDGVVRVEATAASRLGGRAGRRRRSASGHRASSRRVRRAGSLPATPSRCPAEPSMGVLGDGA